ncbi:TonB-dependent receptor [Phenylobacterium sp.]|uniref:TonB-dependent receptor n=1 Tax=Phenylobacterium sp. TaxID=1871053 RepID=UPI00356A911F
MGLCLLTLASRAEAAEARRRFEIAPKPYAEALIDLAVQANVSLLGASGCGAGGRSGLSGEYSLSDALARILSGAPCSFRIVDAQTVRITALAPAAHAAAATPGAPLVTEVLVTARKRPERLDTLPAGVSVISGEQLFATGAVDTRGTAGQLVGVLMTNLGPGRDKLMMRGLSDGAFTGRARSTVSTYLNDGPINYNAPDPDLRLTDVERVETVRGPQGALYGSGALTGVYRIVTNKPDPERIAGGVQATAANTQGGSPSYDAEGYLNLPLVQNRAAVRLVAYYDEQGGYLDNVPLRLSNVDSTSRAGGRVALRFALGDRWTLDLAAAGQRLNSRDTQYTTLPASPLASPPAASTFRAEQSFGDGDGGANAPSRVNQVREASRNDFARGAATLRGELGWADLTASTSYVQHDYSSLYDATNGDIQRFNSDATLGLYSEAARIRRLVQDIVITSTGAGEVDWLAGIYGSLSQERTPASLDILANQAVTPSLLASRLSSALTRVYNEERRDHLHELALYGEGTWRFAPGWTASAGARAFDSKLQVRSAIVGAPPTEPREVNESRTFSGVSSKLSIQYEFADGPLVYGLFSEGFRPGGVNTTNFLTVLPRRTTFEPDKLENFEIGAKGRFLDRHLVLRVAGFFDLWSNIQSDQYRLSGLAYTANVGDAHIQGLEAEVAYEWPFGLAVQANALLSAPKFTRTNPDFAAHLGSGLPGAPRASGGLLVRYDRPLVGELSLRLVGQASIVGPARLTFDPTLSARTDTVIDADLLAEVVARRWSVGLFVTNPANAASNTFAYGNPFILVGQVRQVTPQRPRTIGVRLAANF